MPFGSLVGRLGLWSGWLVGGFLLADMGNLSVSGGLSGLVSSTGLLPLGGGSFRVSVSLLLRWWGCLLTFTESLILAQDERWRRA